MELCSGGDLFSYIKKRRRIKESVAKYFFAQIVRGLLALHRVNILHRDIKLENIMITALG
jgi:serine/threonine protein kinase